MAQNPLDKLKEAAKSVTDTVDKTVNGTKSAVNSVTNGESHFLACALVTGTVAVRLRLHRDAVQCQQSCNTCTSARASQVAVKTACLWHTCPAVLRMELRSVCPDHKQNLPLAAAVPAFCAADIPAGTKTAVDGVKKAGETVANVGKKSSAAGYANPAVGVFAAAGFGSLLLLAL